MTRSSLDLLASAYLQRLVESSFVWLGGDGWTQASFDNNYRLYLTMRGAVGVRPAAGSGSLFDAFEQVTCHHPLPVHAAELCHYNRIALFCFFDYFPSRQSLVG